MLQTRFVMDLIRVTAMDSGDPPFSPLLIINLLFTTILTA